MNRVAFAVVLLALLGVSACCVRRSTPTRARAAPTRAVPASGEQGMGTIDAPAVPLLVLVETDRWLMTRGTDVAGFALYADGRVIYRSRYVRHTVGTAWEKGYSEFRSAVLSGAERDALVREALGDRAQVLTSLDAEYGERSGSRGLRTTIHVWAESSHHSVTVHRNAPTASVPDLFVRTRKLLRTYTHPKATAWLPATIEVMLGDFSHAADEPVAWPTDWPGLDHPGTKKFRDDYYWVHLPYEDLDRLLGLLRGLNTRFGEPCQPIVIDGRWWGVDFRFPFPAEELWMRK